MKLMYQEFGEPLEFVEGIPNILVIENQELRREFIGMLSYQLETGDGDIILSDNNNILKMEKCTEMVINPFYLDMNQKKVVTKLNNNLRELALDSANYANTIEIIGKVNTYLENLSMQLNYPVILNSVEAPDLIKISGARIDAEINTFFENIIDYMCLLADVLDISLFITVNLGLYVSTKEIKELFKMASYKNINLLLIECSDLLERDLLQRITIVDNDRCIIKNY